MAIDKFQYSENSVNALIMTNRCRVILRKMLGYVSSDNPSLLRLNVPKILLNSLPTKKDKLEAETLIEELKQYDKLICEWYALENCNGSDSESEVA